MRVLIINRSDVHGGAAVVSHRLMQALRDAGVDARMLVTDHGNTDTYVSCVGNTLANKLRFLSERLGIWLRNGRNRDTLFKIDTATHGAGVWKHPWARGADVVVLSWIGQATMSLRGIEKLARDGKRVVWMMHDMWNCTGICHHAGGCTAYTGTCQKCPLLRSQGRDLSTRIQYRKKLLYKQIPITFVAVSHWLADCCRKSSLMREADVRVVGNPIVESLFPCGRIADGMCGIPSDKHILVMGAARLDDTVKGFGRLIAVTRCLAGKMPELAASLHLVLYGDIRNKPLLGQLAIPHTWLGVITDVSGVMRRADVVLSTSVRETLPTTLVEGMASGCVPVAFGNSGQFDIISHMQDGYLAKDADVDDFANGVVWALRCGRTREQQHQAAKRRFDATVIAQQYIEIFNSKTT